MVLPHNYHKDKNNKATRRNLTHLGAIKHTETMKRIDTFRTYTREEALQAVPTLTAKDVPAVMTGSELHRIALRVALRKFNEKGGEK